MVTTGTLTEAMVRGIASDESYRRGQDYFRQGAVLDLTRRGEQISAAIQGSSYEPYQVRATLAGDGIADATCSCPYDRGGACKHIVAVLLAYLDQADRMEEHPPLESVLAPLDRDQLQTLLMDVVARRPELADWVEAHVTTLLTRTAANVLATSTTPPDAPAVASPPLPPPPDPAPIRRQVRGLFRSIGRSYDDYGWAATIVHEVEELLEPAEEWIEAGQGRHAMAILEPVTAELVDGLEEVYDDEGEMGELLTRIGGLWTEAILSAELAANERRSWAKKLTGWDRKASDYGGDGGLAVAALAAEYGWDYPPLVRVLRGEITEKGAWEDEAPDGADELAEARLNVLERQGRFQEYLYLAEAEGQTERYLTMLVRVGRVQEAIDYGLKHLATAEEALALSKALHERGAVHDSLRIAEHGLEVSKRPQETSSIPGHLSSRDTDRPQLARWLRDQAAAAGETQRAIGAARVVVEEAPSLADYQALVMLAGEDWPPLREDVLAGLRRRSGFYREPEIDIFLHEGLIDDAIAALGKHAHYSLVEKVADAALPSHPDWVIQASREQAESIMDAGKAQYYHHAATWLAKMRRAYEVAGRRADWQAYLGQLLAEHARRYKLVPMLKALR